MKSKLLFFALLATLSSLGSAADRLTVTATNKLDIARQNQTLELSEAQLAPLGAKNLDTIHVQDSSGKEILCQAIDTDFDPYHKTDHVIFQANFAPGETKTFTITSGKKQVYKPSDYKAYGRFVRERFDDFAWENDRIAHRTYGKALETWKGEPLTSSSIDIWSKLTPKLIINEWYMMGDAYYHTMTDNGGDDYTAGNTRGDGGNGVWAADKLWVPKNFVNSHRLAAGPIRVLFELDYAPFEVNGTMVSQVLRVSLDAGSQLDHYEVFYKTEDGKPLTAAVGLKTVKAEKSVFNAKDGWLANWEPMENDRGMQGLAAIVNPAKLIKKTQDKENDLLLVKASPKHPFSYWAGFAWDKAGIITTQDQWNHYVDNFSKEIRSPIQISVSAE